MEADGEDNGGGGESTQRWDRLTGRVLSQAYDCIGPRPSLPKLTPVNTWTFNPLATTSLLLNDIMLVTPRFTWFSLGWHLHPPPPAPCVTQDFIMYTGLDNVNDDTEPLTTEWRGLDAGRQATGMVCSASYNKVRG